MKLEEIQAALRSRQIDAWLFYDHHHRDPIAYRILGLPATLFATRRWFYLIPAEGGPLKLVHRIEAGHLDSLPGAKHEYSSYQELAEGVKGLLQGHKLVAMQYSPRNMVPYIGLVDAGTIEMVREFWRKCGYLRRSRGPVRGDVDATNKSPATSKRGKIVDQITEEAFREIGRRVRGGGTHEYEIQQWIEAGFSPRRPDR